MKALVLLLALWLTPALAAAADAAGPIQVTDAWARATPGGAAGSGIVYLTITNTGAAPDNLVGASCPVAGHTVLHRTVEENGISRMPEVAGIAVAPGAKVVLAPSGLHLMLTDLKGPLTAGQTFPVTLTFAKAGKIAATVTVGTAGAMGPDPMAGMKM